MENRLQVIEGGFFIAVRDMLARRVDTSRALNGANVERKCVEDLWPAMQAAHKWLFTGCPNAAVKDFYNGGNFQAVAYTIHLVLKVFSHHCCFS